MSAFVRSLSHPPAAALAALALVATAPAALATTAVDLSGRIVVDGLTNTTTDEWRSDESLFGQTEEGLLEEPINDSKWGFNNDLNQIRVTWDARFLYVAVDAIIWNNNTILLFDHIPDRPERRRGMGEMTGLNAWRRNFVFQGIAPDLFLATWDGNTLPQIWSVDPNNNDNVTQKSVESFDTVATFSQGTSGRSMEAAIPWPFLLGDDAERVFSPDYGDSVYLLPEGISEIRLVGVVTAGPDGTGGPDSAPDNLCGHDIDSAKKVVIDNWATIPLDLTGPDGTGGPDGVVDFRVAPKERTVFHVPPPIEGSCPKLGELRIARPVVSPEQGGELGFEISLTDVSREEDSVRLTAEIFGANGDKVVTLYRDDVRTALSPGNPLLDRWDGRDAGGRPVPGGVYIVRLVLEPELDRVTKAFAVVR